MMVHWSMIGRSVVELLLNFWAWLLSGFYWHNEEMCTILNIVFMKHACYFSNWDDQAIPTISLSETGVSSNRRDGLEVEFVNGTVL